jgi:hypothetical protein
VCLVRVCSVLLCRALALAHDQSGTAMSKYETCISAGGLQEESEQLICSYTRQNKCIERLCETQFFRFLQLEPQICNLKNDIVVSITMMNSASRDVGSMSAARNPSKTAPPTPARDGFDLISREPMVWDIDNTAQNGFQDITYHGRFHCPSSSMSNSSS